MFGFNSPEEFLASVENISQLYVHPEERSSILEKIRDRNFIDGDEMQFWSRDGQIITTRVSVRVIEDKIKGPIYEGFMADVTDQKRMEEVLRDSEERLARSKKMESLGLLAGGVAHDLNNVLSGVVSIPDLLLMDLPQNSKLREPIETIQESGNRAAAIVQDLLTVARGVAITKEPLNLNDIVNGYLISAEFKKLEYYHPTVTVKTNLDTDFLLLLDMIMDPGINGRETYERIIEIHPNQKAIILSGFVETDEVKKAQKLGAGKYIMKPVTLEKIGLAVKEELGK